MSDSLDEIKKGFEKTKLFFMNKKVQNILVLIILIGIIFLGVQIRTQNIPLLVDQTTGEYIPLALDPFYFLRVAETIADNGGKLPEVDEFRVIEGGFGFTTELLPKAVVLLWNIVKIFDSNADLVFIDVISPAIFFAISLIIFFFLCYALTNSKVASFVSTTLLAVMPSFLYRTMAGFSDHEAIGIMFFFATMLVYVLSLKYLDKSETKSNKKMLFYALGTGILSALTMLSWGGIAIFLFMIFPLSFLIYWLTHCISSEKKKLMESLIAYYSVWVVSSLIFGLILGGNLSSLLNRFILSSTSVLTLFVFGFVVFDYLIKTKKIKFDFMKEEYNSLYSFLATIVLGILFLIVVGDNPLALVFKLFNYFIKPFGDDRISLTVAENAQPYLTDWINQTGKFLFWIFFVGLLAVGADISKKISSVNKKRGFAFLYVLLISGILFSRVSSGSMFNGTSFLSQIFYAVPLVLFGFYVVLKLSSNRPKLSPEIIFIFSWMFFMLVSSRSAIRFFFALTPFVAFGAGFALTRTFDYLRKSKDELLKLLLFLIFLFILIGICINISNSIQASSAQAKSAGPSANYQWQNAMSWVRENTPEGSIFVHWWDYGYWVQYLGERPTLADGGHFQGGFRDHLIGRYVLTNSVPELALSFMKANGVSYLLIDPTDLGKYGAYSSIGSDETGQDRLSYIPTFFADNSQVLSENDKQIKFYSAGGGLRLDEDIVYGEGESQILLPKDQTALVGLLFVKEGNSVSQPEAVFIYNGQQIRIPLRYAYFEKELIDFGLGLEGAIYILPALVQQGQSNLQIDFEGSSLYLSPRVFNTLFAQLYLMDDPQNKYPTINLVKAQEGNVVSVIRSQGAQGIDFVYYQGFQGPIKIWKVDYPPTISGNEEFLRNEGKYAEFDSLTSY